MSGIRDMLFGSRGTPATVQDITPQAFAGLQQPVAQNLQNIISQGGLPQFESATTAPLGEGEQARLAQIQHMAEYGTPSWEAARGTLMQQMDGSQVAPGASQSQLPPEIMQQLMAGGAGVGSILSPEAQRALDAMFSGQGASLLSPQASSALEQMALTGGGRLGSDAQTLMGSLLTGQTLDPSQNPHLQAAIEMAQRPILDQFGDANIAQRSQFAQAGQGTTARASSPFDVAQARLQTGLAGALGDVGTRLVADNLTQERNRQMQALTLSAQMGDNAAARQLQAIQASGQMQAHEQQMLMQALGLAGNIGAQQQGLGLQAQGINMQGLGMAAGIRGQELDREQSAFEAAQQRALAATGQAAGMARTEFDAITAALQAEALPRLIEQQGIDRGMDMFNQQQATLLQALGLAGQMGQQQTVTLPGTEGTGGILGPALTAAATAFGGPIGGALASQIV